MNLALELSTLSIVNALVVLVCGIAFLLETVIRRSDDVGRLWSMFFIGLVFALFAYLVGTGEPAAWWAFAGGNGAFVASLGLLWAGGRRADGRRPLLGVVLGAAVLTLAVGLLHGPGHGYWTGALALFAGAAVFCGLAASEFMRGPLGRLPSARVLAVALGVMAVYNLTRSIGYLVLGPEDPVWDAVYGAAASTLLETAVTALGAMTLSSVQAERFRRTAVRNADYGTRVTINGMLSAADFRAQADSWLTRSVRTRTVLVLLLVELADLSEVNLAFGRAAGDAAIRLTGRIALSQAPTAALVGHLSPRRFALLLELPPHDSVEAIAGRIGHAVLSTPIDEQDRFRASTFHGIATTRSSGARYDDLYGAAVDAVARDQAAGRALAEQAERAARAPGPA